MLDEILVARRTALHADPAAVLRTVLGQRSTLDITHMRNGDHHLLIGVEIFRIELLGAHHELRAAFVAVFLPQLDHLVLDDLHLQFGIHQHLLEVFDPLAQFVVFGFELVALEAGQRAEAHVDNRSGLHLAQRETLDQTDFRLVRGFRRPDDADHLVNVVHRDEQPFEDVRPLLGLFQIVLRTAHHHVVAVTDEIFDHVA